MKNFLFVLAALICVSAPVEVFADGHQKAADEAVKLSIKKDGDRQVVMIGDEVFTAYNDQDTTKPYLYPIIGPTGASMTRNFPMKQGVEGEASDHPHHTSLWFAHGNVNGIDFWHSKDNGGLIFETHLGWNEGPSERVFLTNMSAWGKKGEQEPIARGGTTYGFEILPDGSRVIDYSTTTKPADGVEKLLFGDTKEGTMAIRVHPALRLKGKIATGKCINSNGDKDNDCWGKRAKWVAYWGVIDGKTCGVAVFDHPTNLRHPTWWHARDYGLIAANPFGVSDFEKLKPRGKGEFTLKQGEELNLRYRFVFFAGTAEQAQVAKKYEQWVQETTPKEGEEEPEE